MFFFQTVNGLVFQFESVGIGQHGILILIMFFHFGILGGNCRQAPVLLSFSVSTPTCTYSPHDTLTLSDEMC